jgi:hypothetical protein
MVENKTVVEKDNELLQATFKGNESLLKLLRSLFFGWSVSDADKQLIKDTFKSEDLREAVRRRIYSKFGDDAPLGSISDFWIQIPEEKLIGVSDFEIHKLIASRSNVLVMLKRAMEMLADPELIGSSLDFSPKDFAISGESEMAIFLIARNKYLNAIEAGLNMIKTVAEMKQETMEELKKRLAKNSQK